VSGGEMRRPARVAVIYYSSTGDVHRLAHALAEDAEAKEVVCYPNLRAGGTLRDFFPAQKHLSDSTMGRYGGSDKLAI
jgi:hypothetical protein